MTIRKTILLASACALIAAPAFAASTMSKTNSMAPSHESAAQTTGSAASGSAALSAQDFVNKAAITDMFEIQAAQLAEQKDQRTPDQKFAKRMIEDHSKTTDQLKLLVSSGKVQAQLPSVLDDEHQQKLDHLKSLSGKQFDNAYDQAQKQGHRDAVATFQRYAQNGDNPALAQWAKKTLPTLKQHLAMAQKLK